MHNLLAGFEFIFRGGFMMYPLLFSALLALTVIFERFFAFRKRFLTPPDLVKHILEKIRGGDVKGALSLCESHQNPVGSVLAAGLENFTHPVEEMELSMKNQAEEWVPLLEKRIDVIDTVITAAPLMGLLGTITGMMSSFRVLSEKGVNEPNAITGGVAEALIATATGLVIALLCLVAYNYLSTKIKEFIYELEGASSKLMQARLFFERNNKK
jgi:biopolymer transport protein ExbB